MPKVTMTWELPEDQHEFMDAFRGWQWKLLVGELDEWLRKEIKYNDKEEYQPVREKLYELVSEEGLRIWE
jgi:hypothetical protein